ncbi:MAG TPA: phosphodiester glycosidase family protein [Candidatus Woesebacteria bacterium]|nr:phosphodiester glycosidase family protein [Candidatus Woesebacteria bacterium]
MKKKSIFPHFHPITKSLLTVIFVTSTVVFFATTIYFFGHSEFLKSKLSRAYDQIKEVSSSFETFKKTDQVARNDALEKEIKTIEITYETAAKTYEEILKLREIDKDSEEINIQYAEVINFLSKRNIASAESTLASLNTKIKAAQVVPDSNAQTIPANVATNNVAPSSGYSRQYVKNEYGTYMVDIIAADLNSTRIIVDTASDGTCGNDCPVSSLADYASRSGAFAGINGPYFCPAEYPACADKKNSFDTLLMNKNKTYFNSDNNVYSTVPAVIFSGNSARYVGQSLDWGRDTAPDSVIASQPMLLSGGNVVYGGDDEIKRAGKGSRSFIGSSGSTVYIGVVYNANVAEVAQVLKTMGLQNALNLDSGGSTALWSGGRYIAGPGRNTPFGILFVNK